MKFYGVLAKKRLATEKAESLLQIITIAASTAALFMALSMSINYFAFLIKESQSIIGVSFSQLLKNNLTNLKGIGAYLGVFFAYLNSGSTAPPPQAENSDSIFSPSSSVENLPSTILLLLVLVLIMVNISLSIVFNLTKKKRRGFLITMLASGDTMSGVVEYVRKETQYLLFKGVMIGVASGTVGIYAVKFIAKAFFKSRNFSPFPVNINLSLTALAVTVLIIILLTFKFSKRTYKNISIKNVASVLKTKLVADNGIRNMTAEPKRYVKKGMEHFVSIGNFFTNIMNYMGMIGTTTITLLIFAIIVLMFDVMRNYNGQELLSYSPQMIEFSFTSEIYFFAVAIPLIVVSVFAVFSSVFANITSNTGIYALMRSSGSDIGSVLRTVRKEGNITALTCCVFVLFVTVYITVMTVMIFISDKRVDFSGLWKIWLVVVVAIMLIFVSIFVTANFMRKKMKKLDMIGTLKNLYY